MVENDIDYYGLAKTALDLDSYQAFALFYGQGENLAKITPKWAARVIRHLIKTGEVDWHKFRPGRKHQPPILVL